MHYAMALAIANFKTRQCILMLVCNLCSPKFLAIQCIIERRVFIHSRLGISDVTVMIRNQRKPDVMQVINAEVLSLWWMHGVASGFIIALSAAQGSV